MVIAVASGKGGTGKTTISVSLAIAAAPVVLVDADVEEPNANILLRAEHSSVKRASLPFPIVDVVKCDFCEKCSEFCAYNAIVVLKGLKVFAVPEICKSCGGCALVCPQDAIREKPRDIGYIKFGERLNVKLIEGELKIGETQATPLIRMLWKNIPNDLDVIIDSPPGAAHPMVEAVRNSDFVLLVTEPTPFGLHDLREAMVVVKSLGKKAGLLINRADVGTDEIRRFASENNLPILMEIPFDEQIARHYSMGWAPAEFSAQWREEFRKLWVRMKEHIQ